LTIPGHPKDESLGMREIPFAREIYIDQSDFMEDPPKDFKRLIPGQEVRLRGAYVIRCDEVIKDAAGNVVELKCSHDENTLGKNPEGRKVKGVIHWVPAAKAVPMQVRLYDRLFNDESPDAGDKNFLDFINPDCLLVVESALGEPSLANATSDMPFQFEREGYFVKDAVDSTADKLVFNRTITLRDTWAKGKG